MISTAHIVALLDHTPEASSVIRTAHMLLSSDAPSRLHLVHVVEALTEAVENYLFPYACFGDDREMIIADLQQAARGALGRRFRDESAFDDRLLRVTYGRVAAEGLQELDAVGPELVVVGAHSSEHPEIGVIGKNAGRFARRARVPVLVVREKVVRRYSRLSVALDLGNDSSPLFSDAIDFAHRLGATLTPIHVLASLGSHDFQRQEIESPQELDDGTMRRLDKRYRQILNGLSLSFPAQQRIGSLLQAPRLAQGDVGKALVKQIAENDTDLLVMYRHQSSAGSGLRLGRVAEYALRYAPCDVLVLPPPISQDLS